MRLRGKGLSDIWVVSTQGLLHYDGSTFQAVSTSGVGTIHDVWSDGLGTVWVVDWLGVVYSATGPAPFKSVSASMGQSGWSLWGNSSTDIWLSGHFGGLYHFDGISWSSVSAPTNLFDCMAGSGSKDGWLMSHSNWPGSEPVHWDGTSWTVLDKGWRTDLGPYYGVFALRPDSAWAVGAGGRIMHWDGTTWASMIETFPKLNALWASGPRDYWAVGQQGTILHHDGTAWSQLPSGTTESLRAVWGSGPEDVWIVGDGDTLLHYDRVSLRNLGLGRAVSHSAVWGSGPDDVWIADAPGHLWHWNGTAFDDVSIGSFGVLSLWGSRPDDVWAVGENATIVHYDGLVWSPASLLPSNRAILNVVWGTGSADVWAGGLTASRSPLMLHFDGTSWATADLSQIRGGEVYAIWGAAPDEVWALQKNGILAHWDGKAWGVFPMITSWTYPRAIWGTGPEELRIIGTDYGQDAFILRYGN